MLCDMKKQFRSTFRRCRMRVMHGVLLMLMGCVVGLAQSFVTVDKNIEVLGVPAVPAALAAEVAPYSQIYGLPLAGWDPTKREIWLKGLSSMTWISRVKSPGASPETSSIYIQSPSIYDVYFQPQYKYLAYTKDTEGNENFQLTCTRVTAVTQTNYPTGNPEILNQCGPTLVAR